MPERAHARGALRYTTAIAAAFLLAAMLVAVTATSAFAVQSAPTVTSLTLGSQVSTATQQLGGLLVAGGQSVTITGTNFTSTSCVGCVDTVQWGATTLSSGVTVNSKTSITVMTPPEPAGTVVHVKVTVGTLQSADNPQRNVAGYVGCTFNGSPPNSLISGVVPGSTHIAVDCVNASPNQSFVLTVASPLAGFVSPSNFANDLPLIMGPITSFSADSTGHLSQTYTVPTQQQGTDPDAKCPPSQDQMDVGLLDCAFAVADTNTNNYGDALLAYATGQLTPDVPNLVVSPTSGNHGDTVTVTPCNFSVTPHTGSCGWWGETAATPIPAANVSIGGAAASTASLSVSAPVYTENSAHNGGTLTGGSLSGTFNVPSGAPGGAQTLKIDEPNGSFDAGNGPGNTVEGSTPFTVNGVVAAPTVTAVSPTSGPTAGGTTVTITGTNLSGATGVDFGGTAATGLTNNTATSIQVTSPAHAAGTVDVHVTTTGGPSATNAPADHYTYNAPPPAPTVTAVSPTSGPTAGGTTVTITGTNLSGALGVSFGGTAATGLTNNTATSIQVTAPAEAPGTVDVMVTTAGGTSAVNAPADEFTYIAPAAMSCDMGAGLPGKPGKPNKNLGTVKFAPGQTASPSVKKETIKLSGTLENCTGFGAVGSKLPITAGAFTAAIQLPPGASCANFVPGTPIKTKLTIKWEGINPKSGKLASAAPTDSTTVTTFVQNSSPFGFGLTSAPLAGTKSLFMGKSVSMNVIIDQTAAAIATLCSAPGGLKALNFTGVNGTSTLSLS